MKHPSAKFGIGQNFCFKATMWLRGHRGLLWVGPRAYPRSPIGQKSSCHGSIGFSKSGFLNPYITRSAILVGHSTPNTVVLGEGMSEYQIPPLLRPPYAQRRVYVAPAPGQPAGDWAGCARCRTSPSKSKSIISAGCYCGRSKGGIWYFDIPSPNATVFSVQCPHSIALWGFLVPPCTLVVQ